MNGRYDSSNEELLTVLDGKNSLVDVGQVPKKSFSRCIWDGGVGDVHGEHAECEGYVRDDVNTIAGDTKDDIGDEEDA